MSVASAIARFRSKQAEQFTATATVHRPIGEVVFTPETGSVQNYELVYSSIACKLSSEDRSGNDVGAGETTVRLVDQLIKFPVESDLQMDDIVTVSSSLHNPTDVGRQYRVTDVDRREWQISRRCNVVETLVPQLNEEGGS